MIVDGKKIAEEVLRQLEERRRVLPKALQLGIVLGVGNAATESYVRIKERTAGRLSVSLVRELLPEQAATADAVAAVQKLSEICDGVIVQLPLPQAIHVDEALAAVALQKDVDGIGREPRVLPPVVGAMKEILERSAVSLRGKKVAVVGKGRLVGAPAAEWFRSQQAEVSILPDASRFSVEVVANADIVVLGAGSAGILQPEMIREGAIILDAGTSESGGEVRGDASPACASKASIFTPVPGGIGPIAIAMIFKNLFALAQLES